MRKFNVIGACIPNAHHMVDVTNKLQKMKIIKVEVQVYV